MTTSATLPLFVGLEAAITTDPALAGLLAGDRVYAGRAPAGARMPYLTIGDAQEMSAGTFGQRGKANTLTLHVWAPDMRTVLAIYAELERLLDGREVPLAGHVMVQGAARLVTVLPDTANKLVHGVVEYAARTLSV